MNKKILIIIFILLLLICSSMSVGFMLSKKVIVNDVRGNEVVNTKKESAQQSIINNTKIQGIVQVKYNGEITLTENQYFGELGYRIEEYSFVVIKDNKQKCIDYFTQEVHDTNYIDIGDILICSGELTQNRNRADDFDTKENSIIVLKKSDFEKRKKEVLDENKNHAIVIGDLYLESQYLYLKFEIIDNSNSTETYHFPFIERAYIRENTKVIGEIEKGKKAKVKYHIQNEELNEIELESMEVAD